MASHDRLQDAVGSLKMSDTEIEADVIIGSVSCSDR
jgi:hypothetical protein